MSHVRLVGVLLVREYPSGYMSLAVGPCLQVDELLPVEQFAAGEAVAVFTFDTDLSVGEVRHHCLLDTGPRIGAPSGR